MLLRFWLLCLRSSAFCSNSFLISSNGWSIWHFMKVRHYNLHAFNFMIDLVVFFPLCLFFHLLLHRSDSKVKLCQKCHYCGIIEGECVQCPYTHMCVKRKERRKKNHLKMFSTTSTVTKSFSVKIKNTHHDDKRQTTMMMNSDMFISFKFHCF